MVYQVSQQPCSAQLASNVSRNSHYSTHRKIPHTGKYRSLTEVQNYGTASQLRQSFHPP